MVIQVSLQTHELVRKNQVSEADGSSKMKTG
jgi:hypothetical protein